LKSGDLKQFEDNGGDVPWGHPPFLSIGVAIGVAIEVVILD
jgi:hypothetical protein